MKAESGRRHQTICRGVLRLQGKQEADLLDVAGRRVVLLQPGENDIRRLAPGIYFVRTADGDERSAVRKVVIQR